MVAGEAAHCEIPGTVTLRYQPASFIIGVTG